MHCIANGNTIANSRPVISSVFFIGVFGEDIFSCPHWSKCSRKFFRRIFHVLLCFDIIGCCFTNVFIFLSLRTFIIIYHYSNPFCIKLKSTAKQSRNKSDQLWKLSLSFHCLWHRVTLDKRRGSNKSNQRKTKKWKSKIKRR